jgi:N-acetylmuramoyl-L-alanine amidase
MISAASRWFALVLISPAALCCAAAEPAPRALPTRPGATASASKAGAALPTRKFGVVDYVALSDVAARLGFKLAWLQPGRKVSLAGPAGRAELENDSRDISINGLRVFLGDPVLAAGGQLFVSRIDFERCLAPQLRPGFGALPLPAPRTIVLDPGHGGKDNGTSLNEKTFALDVARRAQKILAAAGLRVVLTRETDVFLDLPERSAKANAGRADLFVSIHFNALANDSKTSGVELYSFAPKAQHATGWLGKKNDPDLETSDMPVNRFDHWNVVLAQSLHRRLVGDLKAFDRGRKLAHWGVLRGLECPGVLVECGFLTSTAEAKKIATPAYRQKIAEALAAGVRDYVATVASLQPKPATVARTPAP